MLHVYGSEAQTKILKCYQIKHTDPSKSSLQTLKTKKQKQKLYGIPANSFLQQKAW